MLNRALRNYGFNHDVSQLLSMLMTSNNCIPHGSPLSSDALNLHLEHMDRRISAWCNKKGMSNTRTYDDLLVATNDLKKARDIGRFLENNIKRMGLSVNCNKRRESGTQPRHKRQLAHNLVINRSTGVAIPKEQRLLAISMVESLVRGAKSVSPDSLVALATKRRRIVGWMNYCRQMEYAPSRHLKRLIRQADRIVLTRLERFKLNAYKNKWWVMSTQSNHGTKSSGRNEPLRLANAWRKRIALAA